MSVAVSREADTRLARAFAAREAEHPGQSGVAILDYGPLAFYARTGLADLADRTIDVQYYIYEADRSGLLLLQRLKAAADRGVRVRILIDDNNLAAQDVQLAQFAGHPNVQVRVFNPFRNRVGWTKPFQYLTDFSRTNRRMHNKIFAVDNRAVIIGGRNVGDNYFDLDEKSNFTDFDLLVVGPAATQASSSFDEYWNSEWAVPAAAFAPKEPTEAETARLFEAIDNYAAEMHAFEERFPRIQEDFSRLLRPDGTLTWSTVEIISDPPEKIDAKRAPERSIISQRIYREIQATRRELLVESAYFVPRRGGVRMFRQVRDRGADVRILTNSLASNDVPLVHAGYQKHRRDLLEMGVSLHEFQLQAGATRTELRMRPRPASSDASLHSKAMVFDRSAAFVGSFNLDPRSARLNTEIGVFVKNEKVATQLATKFADDFSPSRSWRLELEPTGIAGRRRLVWIGERNGEILRLYKEPDTTAPLRGFVHTMAWFPGLDYLL